MPRQMRAKRNSPRNKAEAALSLAALGLVLVLVPRLLGHSIIATMFRPFAPIGWLMLVGGSIGLWLLRRTREAQPGGAPAQPGSVPRRAPARPERPAPLVERLDATGRSVFEPANDPVAADGRQRPTTWVPAVFAAIEWRRFEAVVETLFSQAGFVTKAQSHGPDEGIDVWLYSKNQADGAPVSVVQCKHWQGKPVGVDKVRELRGVMAAKGVSRGQFATTSTFTPDAVSFAESNGIKLHDMSSLLRLIGSRTHEQQEALLSVALEGEYWKPTCASCGIKMVEREPTAGGRPFWGCSNFPKCRTTMPKRVP